MHLFQPVANTNIVVDMIIQNTSIEGHTDLTFTVPKGDLKKTLASRPETPNWPTRFSAPWRRLPPMTFSG